MLKSSRGGKSESQGCGRRKRVSRIPRLRLVLLIMCVAGVAGCRRDMQDQPKMKPYRASTFYADQLAMRQPVEGTVPRGFLKTDVEFFTGKKKGAATQTQPAGPSPAAGTSGAVPQGAAAYPDDIEYFPMPIDEKAVKRGKERYEIFCSACHGLTGQGDGMIVRRGFRRAASFHDDRLRQAPVGHYFDAITNGWGVMPSYAPQIPVQDRWAIIAYIRALQLTQQQVEQNQATGTSAPAPQPSATPAGGHQ
jgi:mono/diheme cytochrome c family protein